ncbi:MAG: STN domain-containing protein [Gammaproteobacteria bacterium]
MSDVGPAPVAIRITAPTMTAALIQLSQQTGLQVIFQTDDIATQLRAPSLEGRFTARAALKELLRNSGLSYQFVNERTVSIAPAAKQGAPHPAVAASADKSR